MGDPLPPLPPVPPAGRGAASGWLGWGCVQHAGHSHAHTSTQIIVRPSSRAADRSLVSAAAGAAAPADPSEELPLADCRSIRRPPAIAAEVPASPQPLPPGCPPVQDCPAVDPSSAFSTSGPIIQRGIRPPAPAAAAASSIHPLLSTALMVVGCGWCWLPRTAAAATHCRLARPNGSAWQGAFRQRWEATPPQVRWTLYRSGAAAQCTP